MSGDKRRTRLVGAAVVLLALSACSGGDSKVDSQDAAAASSTTAPSLTEDLTAPTVPTASSTPTPTTAGRGAPAPTAPRAGATPPRPTTTTTARAAAQPPPSTTTTTARTGPTAAITIQNFAFSPPVLNISAGTTVTATNLDSAPHSWTADDGSWDSGTLNKDGKHSRTFAAAGTFPYHCEIHPSMKGTVRVT